MLKFENFKNIAIVIVVFAIVFTGIILLGKLMYSPIPSITLNSGFDSDQLKVGQSIVVNGVQEVSLTALSSGFYDKDVIELTSGVPVKLTFTADRAAGCGRQFVIPDFGIDIVVPAGGSEVVEFTPTKPGEYVYRCGMNMFRGKFIVK